MRRSVPGVHRRYRGKGNGRDRVERETESGAHVKCAIGPTAMPNDDDDDDNVDDVGNDIHNAAWHFVALGGR